MEVECSNILDKLDDVKEIGIQGYKYYEGLLQDKKIVISLSKVGLIHASASLSLAISRFNPSIILNIGIAGATSEYLHTRDIVVGESVININSYRTPYKKKDEGSHSDEWELVTFLSGEEDRLIEEKANSNLLKLTKEIFDSDNVYYGTIGSGDVWNKEIDRIVFLNQNYHILCEDMESIATYTIANKCGIPVLSIKMISDNILTNEEYDRDVGLYLQDYMMKFLLKIIR